MRIVGFLRRLILQRRRVRPIIQEPRRFSLQVQHSDERSPRPVGAAGQVIDVDLHRLICAQVIDLQRVAMRIHVLDQPNVVSRQQDQVFERTPAHQLLRGHCRRNHHKPLRPAKLGQHVEERIRRGLSLLKK